MNIEAVDFFYLSMPVVTDAGDGSQDALLVRVAAGGLIGWGECEASPLTSIAAYVTPMSHGACRPVRDVVLGKPLDGPADIAALAATVELECMDLLQAAHTFSGIEMALWDLLGRKREVPVYELLGYPARLSETPLCVAALRRYGGGDAGGVPSRPRARFPRGQMRVGSVRAWHAFRGSRPPPGGAGGPRSRRNAPHRCWADLPRGRRRSGGAHRHARRSEHDVVRGTVPWRRL